MVSCSFMPPGGLVQNHQLRPGRQRTGNLQQPLIAVSEILRQVLRFGAQPHEIQRLHRRHQRGFSSRRSRG